ncbi:hypothetical protein MKY84_08115 [Chryseomicrobium sp. FSL W7-1435]|uniref:hypothetical protein n=1 Tax=Chryseomicrobium sp. FSL W7-1435 TaxID=2921704 RepID=UPI00315A9681
MRFILASLTICLLCYAIQMDWEVSSSAPCVHSEDYSLETALPTSTLESIYSQVQAPISYLEWIALVRQLNPNDWNFSEQPFVYPKWSTKC